MALDDEGLRTMLNDIAARAGQAHTETTITELTRLARQAQVRETLGMLIAVLLYRWRGWKAVIIYWAVSNALTEVVLRVAKKVIRDKATSG